MNPLFKVMFYIAIVEEEITMTLQCRARWTEGFSFAIALFLSGWWALALKHRLPVESPFHELTRTGGLMSYSTDVTNGFFRSAYYVDQLLRGTKASDLPFERTRQSYVKAVCKILIPRQTEIGHKRV